MKSKYLRLEEYKPKEKYKPKKLSKAQRAKNNLQKLVIIFCISVAVQIFMYFSAISMTLASHNSSGLASGLGALVPEAMFFLLLPVNFGLLIAYMYKTENNKAGKVTKYNVIVFILVLIVITLIALWGPIYNWADNAKPSYPAP